MTSPRQPLEMLRELSVQEASGELVCASDEIEVHVYLQAGKVAWATSSASRFAFRRHLLEQFGLESSTLRELVEDCRRNRRPLGETLVEWQLATTDQVREALQLQVADALGSLADHPQAAALFLARRGRFLSYDVALTFELSSVWPENAGEDGRSDGGDDRTLAERVYGAAHAIRWVEVMRDQRITARHPADAAAPKRPHRLAEGALGGDVDFVALRTERGTVLGMAHALDASVWVGVEPDAPLGTVVSRLTDVDQWKQPSTQRPSNPPPPAGSMRTGGDECEDCRTHLLDAVERSGDALAVVVLDRESNRLWHSAREGTDGKVIGEWARDRVHLLVDGNGDGDGANGGEPAVPFEYRSMVLGKSDAWHFATELPDASGRKLWLMVRRSASLGLGWALLTGLSRQLVQMPCEMHGEHAIDG